MLLEMFNVKKWNILKIMIHIKYFLRRAGKGRGTKIKSDKKGGATTKKVMSPGGMGAEQFDRRFSLVYPNAYLYCFCTKKFQNWGLSGDIRGYVNLI